MTLILGSAAGGSLRVIPRRVVNQVPACGLDSLKSACGPQPTVGSGDLRGSVRRDAPRGGTGMTPSRHVAGGARDPLPSIERTQR